MVLRLFQNEHNGTESCSDRTVTTTKLFGWLKQIEEKIKLEQREQHKKPQLTENNNNSERIEESVKASTEKSEKELEDILQITIDNDFALPSTPKKLQNSF